MKLYSFSNSCGLAANIVLAWIGKPYDVQLIDMADLATPAMRSLNPNGFVPILDDGGWVLYENAAVLNYLADKFPEAKLGGNTPHRRAEVNRWLAILNSNMHPAFKPLFGATSYLEDEAAITKSKNHAGEVLRTYFERLDRQLDKHDWLTMTCSVADPYLFVMLRWCKIVNVDLSGFANLARFEQRMRADAGVQRALQEQEIDQATA